MEEGFAVITATDGEQALTLYRKHQPALVCLDIMMPHLDGFEVCRRIRQKDAATPILFLSAKNEEIDVVVGLELGADDFVRKPFGKRELLARVRAALRRQQAAVEAPDQPFAFGHLEVYVRELRAVTEDGSEIDLSPREVSMLSLLYQCANQVVHRDKLLDHCWGLDYYPESRTLDQHIAKLRKKVEIDPANPLWIETVRGVGYRYRPRR
jgi:DNA-binding response OmpR family regulator